MTDEEITTRLMAGDPQIVATLRGWINSGFRTYRRRLAADLEDLEQEILLELMGALREGRFDGRSQLRTYVTTYVHHKCIDRLRFLGRREWVAVEDLDLRSPTPSPLERLAEREKVEVALRVVEEMPESCRELWQLLRQGLGYREMSQRLGISDVTLRSRVLRCRRRALEARARLLGEDS